MNILDINNNINQKIKDFLVLKKSFDTEKNLKPKIKLKIIEIKNYLEDEIIYDNTCNYKILRFIKKIIDFYFKINNNEKNFLFKIILDFCNYNCFEFIINYLFFKKNKNLEIIFEFINHDMINENYKILSIIIQNNYLLFFNKENFLNNLENKRKIIFCNEFQELIKNKFFNKIIIKLFENTSYSRIYIYCYLLIISNSEDYFDYKILIQIFEKKIKIKNLYALFIILKNTKNIMKLKELINDYLLFSLFNIETKKIEFKENIFDILMNNEFKRELYNNILNIFN